MIVERVEYRTETRPVRPAAPQRRPAPRGMGQRLAFLGRRRDALRGDLARARDRAGRMAADLDRLREGLAMGRSDAAEVGRRARAVEQQQAAVAHVEQALGTVEAEMQELGETIGQREHAVERQRQEKAARPLKAKAAREVDEFIQALTGAADHLVGRLKLGEQIARRFPLAGGIDPVTLEMLARRVIESWRGPRPWGQNTGHLHGAFRIWIRTVLLGPVQSADLELRQYGVTER